jgi:diadenosine tetraphosphate (Ap4A) HIT family hydrolase
MFFVAKKIAKDLGIDAWYQLHFNVWVLGWQEVMHIHLHLTSDI